MLWIPEGKGNPVWHEPTKALFLGIDHTAMTVCNTENSITFDRDLLGLTVAGGTLNMGTEQEHLDSLPGVRDRVTGLNPQMGSPGIEFLEYELPAAGRPFQIDSHPTDLWHWQTTLVDPDVDAAATTLRATAQFVSSAVVILLDKALGFTKGLQVCNPDGHAIQTVSPCVLRRVLGLGRPRTVTTWIEADAPAALYRRRLVDCLTRSALDVHSAHRQFVSIVGHTARPIQPLPRRRIQEESRETGATS